MRDERITINEAEMSELLSSGPLRAELEKLGFQITAHARPHIGRHTGLLVNSLGHRIEKGPDGIVLYAGSGARDGVDPVAYAGAHIGGPRGADLATESEKVATSRKRIRGKRKPKGDAVVKTPTRAYSKALDELGIPYTRNPGGEGF